MNTVKPNTFMNNVTRTDVHQTRAPADTPRARMHRLAAWGARCGHRLGAKNFAGVCEALTTALALLEASEAKILELETHNDQLRASLAALGRGPRGR